jgi:hypothetical protein
VDVLTMTHLSTWLDARPSERCLRIYRAARVWHCDAYEVAVRVSRGVSTTSADDAQAACVDGLERRERMREVFANG